MPPAGEERVVDDARTERGRAHEAGAVDPRGRRRRLGPGAPARRRVPQACRHAAAARAAAHCWARAKAWPMRVEMVEMALGGRRASSSVGFSWNSVLGTWCIRLCSSL